MLMNFRPRADLRTLIALLVIISIVITLANNLYATWRVQRMVLIDSTLEANRAYAAKLASTSEVFFRLAQSQLHFSANVLGKDFDNEELLKTEVNRLREQTDSFNSVAVVDENGTVRAISPESLTLTGMHLTSDASREALQTRQPMISKPTVSAANNLLIFVSWPIWNSQGRYLGYVGGTIYLKKKSILNALLGEQFYRDGTSVFVLDSNNQVLYHQNRQLVGKTIPPLLSDRERQEKDNGSLVLTETDKPTRLAGYAIVPTTGWMVVALKPVDATLQPLSGLILKVLKHSVPFALLTLLVAVILARMIAMPLWQLARKASKIDGQSATNDIGGIHAWYFEAAQVKRALLTGIGLVQDKIGRLSSEAQTDPLTQLLNRRGLNAVLDYFQTLQQPFAVLALDIDHFKNVNDNWGHDVGDRVIQQVARTLQQSARKQDIVSRNGGEEFLMLLPDTSLADAEAIAERIRLSIAGEAVENVGNITLSIGVAEWSARRVPLETSLKRADDALYQAKNAGRNCTVVAK
ncbi:sensor domain-containing diguanylate cyclase [Pantoea stewartii]|uniref:sensor domain-containing diguanylate cyclase n=1 Tax=Pantoea stewartii TaxID=66269 RepID=UPI000639F4F8|nr:sensor domain-containing diguanylate cyclase [Pantoea stewartii]KKW50571.1 diguanylate cyclase [Pantoea ananatis]MBC0852473.1 GGDEF domain-containing protein [Pantoea stewartii]MDK2635042.1 sensor domain-containing diguanylate cyclase [Pantoea stewartii subsp. indologenes]NRH23576.1 diguanylate cyclase [Pantoea stewartii]QIE96836.1 sensor domain-containing diguanylate cyclase [Pantoea stewartii]